MTACDLASTPTPPKTDQAPNSIPNIHTLNTQRYLQRKTQTTEVLHFSSVDKSMLKVFPPRGKKTRFD